jgi:uncharacterized protein YcbK (DUF882 family)
MIHRRKLLALGLGGVAATAPGVGLAKAFVGDGSRKVALHNLHTNEDISITYWQDGGYLPDALAEVNHVLRDFRTGDVHDIHPELLDLLHTLTGELALDAPLQVISGYRSPKTNARLAASSRGVAHHSLHMEGKAIDIRAPGVPLARLHQTALRLGAGGVGYYPSSDFVHVDIGPVRHWALAGSGEGA